MPNELTIHTGVIMRTAQHNFSGIAALLWLLAGACMAEKNVHDYSQHGIKVTDNKFQIQSLVPQGQNADIRAMEAMENERSIERYEQLISELEGSGGVYLPELSEILLDLGKTYQVLGHHTEAVATFKRSLHISRVNNGLYTLDQLPILELIIKSNTALSDWEELDRNYHYLYWVNRRAYGDKDPRLLPVIDRVGRWHLNAYQLESDEFPFKHLLSADDLFSDAIEIIQANHGQFDSRLISPLYGKALTNYHIAAHASSADEFDEIRTSSRMASRLQRLYEEQDARQQLINDGYRAGKKAMLRVVDIFNNNPDLPADSHAMAIMHLGDWYQLFNRRNTAAGSYEQAYAMFKNDGMESEEINKLFDRPRSLPALSLPLEYKKEPKENSDYVVAKFDVTKTGRAINIEIIESYPPDSQMLRRRAKRTIKGTRFRPRFENGQPVETSGVNLRYIFEN